MPENFRIRRKHRWRDPKSVEILLKLISGRKILQMQELASMSCPFYFWRTPRLIRRFPFTALQKS